MKLSTRTRYGTRALLELALHYDEGRPVQLQRFQPQAILFEQRSQGKFVTTKVDKEKVRCASSVDGWYSSLVLGCW